MTSTTNSSSFRHGENVYKGLKHLTGECFPWKNGFLVVKTSKIKIERKTTADFVLTDYDITKFYDSVENFSSKSLHKSFSSVNYH